MIKLSRKQTEIEGLAHKVPQLSNAQISWAVREHTYFQWVKSTDTEVCCPNCKESISLADKNKDKECEHMFVCPHCGAKIRVRDYDLNGCSSKSRKRNYHQEGFFEVLNVVGNWQVTRLFYMQRYCYIKKDNTKWEFYECCQAWNTPAESNTYFRALPKKIMSSWLFNPYSLWHWSYEQNPDTWGVTAYRDGLNQLMPRKMNGANFFDTSRLAPRGRILPYYKQRGLTNDFLKRNILRSAIGWFSGFAEKKQKPMYETLIKAGEYKFLQKMDYRWRGNEEQYFTAWKIAHRHNYTIKNLSDWFDLIDMLVENNMDWHSPHYVCPNDFERTHNELTEITNRKRERERREADAKQKKELMEKCRGLVEERTEKFGDLLISNGTLHSVVMITYDDYHNEGSAMHHCVGGYFSRGDSLILSMRDNDGKRVETVEVNLTTFEILQSRGVCNKTTPQHDEIVELVESNMWQIRERMGNKRLAKAS